MCIQPAILMCRAVLITYFYEHITRDSAYSGRQRKKYFFRSTVQNWSGINKQEKKKTAMILLIFVPKKQQLDDCPQGWSRIAPLFRFEPEHERMASTNPSRNSSKQKHNMFSYLTR
jgi:hypothetical protein